VFVLKVWPRVAATEGSLCTEATRIELHAAVDTARPQRLLDQGNHKGTFVAQKAVHRIAGPFVERRGGTTGRTGTGEIANDADCHEQYHSA